MRAHRPKKKEHFLERHPLSMCNPGTRMIKEERRRREERTRSDSVRTQHCLCKATSKHRGDREEEGQKGK